jgi:hypothetical protein
MMTAKPARVTMKALMIGAARVGGFSPELIRLPTRDGDIVELRQAAQYLATRRLGFSLSRVGLEFRRDHTTVLHAVRKIDHALEHRPVRTAKLLDQIWTEAEAFSLDTEARDATPLPMPQQESKSPPAPSPVAAGPRPIPVVPRPDKYQLFSPEWWQANDLAFRNRFRMVHPERLGVAA